MPKLSKYFAVLLGFLISFLLGVEVSPSQLTDSVSSEHVIMRMPAGREALGRDAISDIERCYGFMNRATNASLPRRIAIVVNWDQASSSYSRRDALITVGMNRPEAAGNLNASLLHSIGLEIARSGLIELSEGAQREDTEFLFEGMSEILVHEFEHSSRSLEAAWAICRFLDEMQLLGFSTQRTWSSFSAGKRCLRSAAPGITFLTTFRELQDRERPLKLFEALRKASLTKSLELAFRAPAAELESIWLKRVREYRAAEEITVTSEEVPQLLRTACVPETSQPGNPLQLRLFFKDPIGNLLPDGVFIRDERTHHILQAQASPEKDAGYMEVVIPIQSDCPPGQYNFEVTAIDESGNLRRWPGRYKVGSQ